MEKESWKINQYAFIARNSMDWINSTNPERYMNNLSIRNLTQEQYEWLKELAQETGLGEFSGHAHPHGFVKGYKIIDFPERAIAFLKYKNLYLSQQEQLQKVMKENEILRRDLYDYQADLIQAQECEKATKDIVDNTVDNLMDKIQVMEERLDRFLNR